MRTQCFPEGPLFHRVQTPDKPPPSPGRRGGRRGFRGALTDGGLGAAEPGGVRWPRPPASAAAGSSPHDPRRAVARAGPREEAFEVWSRCRQRGLVSEAHLPARANSSSRCGRPGPSGASCAATSPCARRREPECSRAGDDGVGAALDPAHHAHVRLDSPALCARPSSSPTMPSCRSSGTGASRSPSTGHRP